MRRIIIAIMAILSGSATAQDSIVANEVWVIKRIPVKQSALTKTIIDSAQLANSINASFAELLSKNSPVFIKSYGLGSLATVSFRGTAASHTQVLWNGVNINNPMLGQVDFSTIPVWFVDQTELLHGGSSLTQGSGSLGGSVMVNSIPSWDKKIYGSVMQTVASFGTYNTFATLGGGSKNFQVRAKYMYARAKNDFQFYNNAIAPPTYQRQQNADYVKQGATLDMFARLKKDHFITLNGWFFTDNRNLPAIMSYEGKGRTEYQKSDELRFSAKWVFYRPKIKSELIAGYSNTALNYFLANKTDLTEVVNFDSRSKIETAQAKYTFEYTINPKIFLKAVADAQYSVVSILDNITKEGYGAKRIDFGVSVSAHVEFLDWLSAFALVRYENQNQFMPSLGVQFDPLDCLNFKINATRNYHKPTLNDLHWLPGGNPDLLPESGYTADISATFTKFGLTATATGYLSLIDNWIIWQPSEFRYWTATNLRQVFARGVEMNLKYSRKFGKFDLSANANYAFTRTSNMKPTLEGDQSYNRQLIYIPIHKFNASADLRAFGFFVNYSFNFTGERFTTSSNENVRHTLPQYCIHNIAVGKQLKGFEIQARIDNLFDADYQAILWRAMPKRNYQLIFKYTFACK